MFEHSCDWIVEGTELFFAQIVSLGWSFCSKSSSSFLLPPGSLGLPLIGETLEYMKSMSTSNPVFMAQHRIKFGDMFKSKLMGALCVVATKADMIKWVLARDGKQFVTGYPKSFKDVLGSDTVLNTVGEQWKSTRKFVVNGLRTEHLRSRVSVVEDLVLECFDSWETKQIVNVREETKSLAFNVIAQFLLGSRLRSGPVNDALREDFYILCEGLLAIPIKLPGTKFSKALQARARIIETLERDVVSKPRPENDEDHYADYMEHTRRENFPGMTEERLLEKTRSHMLGMMFAGHETGACAMLFAVKYISEHPDVLAELRAEHEKIQAAKYGSDSRLTWDDFKNMRFTQHVIIETLRLSTPVALLWREAIEDVPLHGYVVPKGCKLACALREVHHDPAHYENPKQFNPWRHEKEIVNPANKPPFLAFGGGPRLCPGADLAKLEISIFLHHLVTKYQWELCGGDEVSYFPLPKLSKGLQLRVKKC
ncbi:unnamed protein product, partial [Sphagnum compactum]